MQVVLCEEFITGKQWRRTRGWVTCKTLVWSQFSDVRALLEWKTCPEHGQLEGAAATKKAPFGDGLPVPCISSFLQTHDSLKKRREMKAGKTKSKREGFQLCRLPLAKAVKSWTHKSKQVSSCKGRRFTPSPLSNSPWAHGQPCAEPEGVMACCYPMDPDGPAGPAARWQLSPKAVVVATRPPPRPVVPGCAGGVCVPPYGSATHSHGRARQRPSSTAPPCASEKLWVRSDKSRSCQTGVLD